MKICGVYRITNLMDGKIYIGSGVNLKLRFQRHQSELRHGKHHNKYLQRAWDKHGEINFKFEIIELCDKSILIEREQYWMDQTQCYIPMNGYNLRLKAETNEGLLHSIETKIKISNIKKGQKYNMVVKTKVVSLATRLKMRGKIRSEETKLKMSLAQRARRLKEK